MIEGEEAQGAPALDRAKEQGECLLADRFDAVGPERCGGERMLFEVHHLMHERAVLGWNVRDEKLPGLILAVLESRLIYTLAEVTHRAGAGALDPARLLDAARDRQHGFRLPPRDLSRSDCRT